MTDFIYKSVDKVVNIADKKSFSYNHYTWTILVIWICFYDTYTNICYNSLILSVQGYLGKWDTLFRLYSFDWTKYVVFRFILRHIMQCILNVRYIIHGISKR